MNKDSIVKKNIKNITLLLTLILYGCSEGKSSNNIKFSTSAEYPPFEYHQNGEIKGFDIDLAKAIAKELGKEAVFEDVQFSSVLLALQDGSVDAAISTITITKDRQNNFDFSDPYYVESMAIVFEKTKPILDKAQLSGKKIACQLGTTMEIWLKTHYQDVEIIAMNNNNQAIEALKVGHVDGVLIDQMQGAVFSSKNSNLDYAVIGQSETGYGIAFKKNSPLKNQVNKAIQTLEANGEMKKMKQKWLENTEWKN